MRRLAPLIFSFVLLVVLAANPATADRELDHHSETAVSADYSVESEMEIVRQISQTAHDRQRFIEAALITTAKRDADARAAREAEQRRQRELAAQRARTTTTTTTTTSSNSRAPNLSASYAPGVEQWRSLVARYPWPVDTMLSIMGCESGGDPLNWYGKTRGLLWTPSRASGLFQLNPPPVGWEDPAFNIQYAYEHKYKPAADAGDPFGPWRASRGCWA